MQRRITFIKRTPKIITSRKVNHFYQLHKNRFYKTQYGIAFIQHTSNHFLAIFRNEITTILTRLQKGMSGGGGGGHVFRFEGPWLRIRNVNIYIYIHTYE